MRNIIIVTWIIVVIFAIISLFLISSFWWGAFSFGVSSKIDESATIVEGEEISAYAGEKITKSFFISDDSYPINKPLPKVPFGGTTHYNWIDDNIFVKFYVRDGPDKGNYYYIYDVELEEFIELTALKPLNQDTYIRPTGEILESQNNDGYFAFNYCTNTDVSGGCKQRAFAISNSQIIKEIVRIPSLSYNWGWDGDILFIREYDIIDIRVVGIETRTNERGGNVSSPIYDNEIENKRLFLIDINKIEWE